LRFLIDTNVLSEGARPAPDERVAHWLRAQPPLDLAISVLTLGEVQRGIELLPSGRRRSALESWLATDLPQQFQGRVLAVDTAVAIEWGRLSARSRTSGRHLPIVDGLLLATAAVHGLSLVTRNEADCAARGVPVINPWRASGD
jgi:predicted nucleic acid-binding protein